MITKIATYVDAEGLKDQCSVSIVNPSYDGPTITSITPTEAKPGEDTIFTVNGNRKLMYSLTVNVSYTNKSTSETGSSSATITGNSTKLTVCGISLVTEGQSAVTESGVAKVTIDDAGQSILTES